jgi:hypothetical protein
MQFILLLQLGGRDMKKTMVVLASLSLIGLVACETPTVPQFDAAESARLNGGLLGSGYNNTAPPADSTGRYGGMAGSGY